MAQGTDNKATRQSPHDNGGPAASTRSRILDIGERLVQVRGFNGFSYADVATRAVRHQGESPLPLPEQGRPGEAIIAATPSASPTRLSPSTRRLRRACQARGIRGPVRRVLRDERMCLCGMLAAEYETIPRPIREAVVGFLDDNEAWLALVLEQGRARRVPRFRRLEAGRQDDRQRPRARPDRAVLPCGRALRDRRRPLLASLAGSV